jgi:inhibitor of cysteine peptidase
MMDIIILILTLLLAFFAPVETSSTPPDPIISTPEPPLTGEETFRSYTMIDSVDALLLESFPVQISLQVSGHNPDGCDYPVKVEQRREGNEVFVEIYRELPLAVMCPAVLLEYSGNIHLEGGFEPGTYIIHVNDQVIEVTV